MSKYVSLFKTLETLEMLEMFLSAGRRPT